MSNTPRSRRAVLVIVITASLGLLVAARHLPRGIDGSSFEWPIRRVADRAADAPFVPRGSPEHDGVRVSSVPSSDELSDSLSPLTPGAFRVLSEYPPVPFGPFSFPGAVEVEGRVLRMRGAGRLHYTGVLINSVALYESFSDTIRDNASGAGADSGGHDSGRPQCLIVHYHRALTPLQIIQGAEEGMARNPRIDRTALQSRIQRIYSLFVPVGDGDEYALVRIPGQGLSLALNGQTLGMIPGDDFAEAFLGIWISEHALSPALARLLKG